MCCNPSASSPQDDADDAPAVKRRCVEPRTDVHWVSEGGVIDCRVLLGPSPQQLFSQYAPVTGENADLALLPLMRC